MFNLLIFKWNKFRLINLNVHGVRHMISKVTPMRITLNNRHAKRMKQLDMLGIGGE